MESKFLNTLHENYWERNLRSHTPLSIRVKSNYFEFKSEFLVQRHSKFIYKNSLCKSRSTYPMSILFIVKKMEFQKAHYKKDHFKTQLQNKSNSNHYIHPYTIQYPLQKFQIYKRSTFITKRIHYKKWASIQYKTKLLHNKSICTSIKRGHTSKIGCILIKSHPRLHRFGHHMLIHNPASSTLYSSNSKTEPTPCITNKLDLLHQYPA